MNQKADEFFSMVEKKHNIKLGRFVKCPICKSLGHPVDGNPLVMEHKVADSKRIIYHRWSYASGRKVERESQDTNVL